MSHTDHHSGGGPAPTSCPTDIEVARFVEGTLTTSAKARLLTHLADCDGCREVVATVVAASAGPVADDDPTRPAPTAWWRRGPRRWVVAAATTVAIGAALRFWTGQPPEAPLDRLAAGDVWTEMAASVGATRTVAARLSGLPGHVPLAPPTRAGTSETSFGRQALAARLAESAAVPTTDAGARRAARHAAGVAALVAGRAGDAVALLESALADATQSAAARADILADLSAAHGELGATRSRDHWTTALRAAEEALASRPSHTAAGFNRALALEHLGRREEALSAWRILASDAALAPGWRAEAAGHMRALAR